MTYQISQHVYAARDIWLQEVFKPAHGENYVVVSKGEIGEITDKLDDGRVWVLFEDDEWCCELNMLTDNPSLKKRYREALIIDDITVYYLDENLDSMGEIAFNWRHGELRAEVAIASFGVMQFAQDIFTALALATTLEYKPFVALLQSLGYIEDDDL